MLVTGSANATTGVEFAKTVISGAVMPAALVGAGAVIATHNPGPCQNEPLRKVGIPGTNLVTMVTGCEYQANKGKYTEVR